MDTGYSYDVLLICGGFELRQLYHELFLNDGWEVFVAHDITEGLVELVTHSKEIQLVLLEGSIDLREIKQFLAVIDKKSEWKHIPILIVSDEIDTMAVLNQYPQVHLFDHRSFEPRTFLKIAREKIKN